MKTRCVVFVLALLVLSTAALADTLTVNVQGTFNASVPTSTWSAPNQTFQFSFNVENIPAVSNVTGNGFDVTFTNFSYLLNGVSVSTTPVEVRFFTAGFGGGLDVDFTSVVMDGTTNNGFALYDGQMFSGTTASPTLLAGHYLDSGGQFILNYSNKQSLYGTPIDITIASQSVPEPASLMLLGSGLVLLASRLRKRR